MAGPDEVPIPQSATRSAISEVFRLEQTSALSLPSGAGRTRRVRASGVSDLEFGTFTRVSDFCCVPRTFFGMDGCQASACRGSLPEETYVESR